MLLWISDFGALGVVPQWCPTGRVRPAGFPPKSLTVCMEFLPWGRALLGTGWADLFLRLERGPAEVRKGGPPSYNACARRHKCALYGAVCTLGPACPDAVSDDGVQSGLDVSAK